MKKITGLSDLRPFGVAALTGEADALSFRCLCDLTEQGRGIVAETYGLRVEGFAENWNTSSESGAHVASVMLPYSAWREVGVIALSRVCHTILATEGCLFGLTEGEEYHPAEYDGWDEPELRLVTPAKVKMGRASEAYEWPDCYGKINRTFSFGDHPRVGSRNVHAMSGRAS